jgi:flagellar hook-associated protein 3 FlgL
MRITSQDAYQNLLQGMQGIQGRMLQAQSEISSGNRISTPSQDPAAAADIVRLTGDKSESNQYLSNVGAAQSSLNYTDSVLSNVQTVIQRVISLGESALSNPSTASSYSTEVSSLRGQVVSSANASYQGQFIFGGSATGTAPYVEQPDQSVAYKGNSDQMNVQIGRSTTLQVQIPGNQIFSGSVNVFDSMKQLGDAMNAGDKSAIQAQVTQLQTFYNNLSTVRSQVGGLSNAAQTAQSDLSSYQLALASDQSRVQSADLAQAATDFTQNQTSLQAAEQVGARISQVSILNYL